jgi:hypothetical protein
MAVTLDATVGGATANSYLTVADADAYFDGHQFGATWRALADRCTKARLCITATRILNRRRYRGALVVEHAGARVAARLRAEAV